jgi:hypothetical protein
MYNYIKIRCGFAPVEYIFFDSTNEMQATEALEIALATVEPRVASVWKRPTPAWREVREVGEAPPSPAVVKRTKELPS